MNEMPVVREPVSARVLAHRRNEHTVGKRQITNGKAIEQVGHGSSTRHPPTDASNGNIKVPIRACLLMLRKGGARWDVLTGLEPVGVTPHRLDSHDQSGPIR